LLRQSEGASERRSGAGFIERFFRGGACIGTMNGTGLVSPFQGSIDPFGRLPGVPLCSTPGYHIEGFQPWNDGSWRALFCGGVCIGAMRAKRRTSNSDKSRAGFQRPTSNIEVRGKIIEDEEENARIQQSRRQRLRQRTWQSANRRRFMGKSSILFLPPENQTCLPKLGRNPEHCC